MTNPINVREVILGILIEVLENGRYSHLVLRENLSKVQQLDKINRSFITKISEGTIENKIKIDYIINQFSTIKVNKMKPVIRNILRMSVYQILYMDSVPDSAICNEAVKIAGKRGFVNLKGFVNGILRNISRNQNSISYPEVSKDAALAYSINYSMPEWIVDLWINEYGQELTETMLKGLHRNRPLSVRCNLSKASKEEIIALLSKQGITVEQSELLDEALLISGYDTIENIEAHQKGFIQVQDISSMLVGNIANPSKEDYIIDVCAAPGGKSLHLADKLHGSGHIEARDLTSYKVKLIQENVNRLQFTNIETIEKDATVFDPISVEKADIVIADLPCSGLGVMNKKSDIKYKITPDALESLVNLQRKIMDTVYTYVKPGGVFIYSTCTINSKENEENINWILENYPFALESIDDYLPEELKSETTKKGYLQLYPGIYPTDGFFIARFRRSINE